MEAAKAFAMIFPELGKDVVDLSYMSDDVLNLTLRDGRHLIFVYREMNDWNLTAWKGY